jgi:hypothetical protein
MTIDIVTSLADSGAGSLRAVLAGAQAGDHIIFASALAGGTIVLASTLAIGTAVTIDGSTTGDDITIDGNHAVTDISVNFATITLQHLVIANGFGHGADATHDTPAERAAGGLSAFNAALTLDDVVFANNLAIAGNGTPDEFNAAGGMAGGAILLIGGMMTLADVSFAGNSATGGNSSSYSATGGEAAHGAAGGSAGGAIAFNSGGALAMSGVSFTGNSATGGNGGSGTSYYAQPFSGGPGGGGGAGGIGAGAILAVFDSNPITGSGLTFSGNSGLGGSGGNGSTGGTGGYPGLYPGGTGGTGGAPGQPGQKGNPGGDAGSGGGGAGGSGGAPGRPGNNGNFGDPLENWWSKAGGGGGGGGGGGLGYPDSNVEITCFLAGTSIRTPGGEVPVECLAIGTLVLTHAGQPVPIRWIGHRAYAAPFVRANPALRPVRIAPGALAPGLPARELRLSQNHALFFPDGGGVLVNAGDLLNGTSITLAAPTEVRYFHIELDRHDILLAEGAPAESFLDADCRNLFANADDHARLYPGPRAPPEPCAPRLAHGPVFAAIRARLANLPPPAPPGPMEGQLDQAGPTLEGWVRDRANPDHAVEVELVQGGAVIARDTANRLRRDLAAAAIGQGRHGYRFPCPSGPWQLRRATDGATLPGTPAALPQAGPPGPLRGHIDRIGRDFIEGWVQDLANPLHPVEIEMVVHGQVMARAAADRFRADLAAAGIGEGRHGYRLAIDPAWHPIRLRRAADGAPLPGATAAHDTLRNTA